MTVEEFKNLLLATTKTYFPQAALTLQEKRSIIIEARINIKEGLFVHIYFNALTGRKSYTLIHRSQRALGWDNRRFWHRHPLDNPELHIRCREPALEAVFKEMREAVQKL
jgi:hypothetical protein